MMRISFDPLGRPPRSLAARIVAAVLGVFVFGAAMMFSALVFVGLVLAGLVFWAYFWWKTRALRRTMREEMRAREHRGQAGGANVIEGEAVRVTDEDR
jgi:biopolymer transport protein ExbB/TolQ